jgi:hypothetical protein
MPDRRSLGGAQAFSVFTMHSLCDLQRKSFGLPIMMTRPDFATCLKYAFCCWLVLQRHTNAKMPTLLRVSMLVSKKPVLTAVLYGR